MTFTRESPRTPSRSQSQPRLHLHVGLPKSGTTSVQKVLEHHREVLARNGFCYPDGGRSGHFHAALEMTEKAGRWGYSPSEVTGRFADLLAQGRMHGGDVVISHEMFAQAQPHHVPALVAAASDFEVHLVITMRDIGRVLVASWQESVKNGKKSSFDQFVERKARKLPGTALDQEVFWRYQNVEELLRRWGPSIPPERIHLVVCPPPAATRRALWDRFAEAIGFPAGMVEVDDVPQANASLGAAQVGFLRAVNVELEGRLQERDADRLRKHWLAQGLMSRIQGEKAVAPVDAVERFAPVARSWVELLSNYGCTVHGDLADLLPHPEPGAAQAPHPDDTPPEQQAEGLPGVVAEMLLEVRDLELALADARSWRAWFRRPGVALRALPGRSRRGWRSATSE